MAGKIMEVNAGVLKSGLLYSILAAAVIGAVVLLHRKRAKAKTEAVDRKPLSAEMEETDILDAGSGGDTVLLVNNDSRRMLILTDRANPRRRFERPLQGRLTIGRSSRNQIVLNYEKSVSGTHCEIFLDGKNVRIRDLDSKNGTYVNGIRIGDAAGLSSGSTIKLGRLELIVEIR